MKTIFGKDKSDKSLAPTQSHPKTEGSVERRGGGGRRRLAAAIGVVPMAAALLGASSVRSRLSSGALSSRLAPAAVVSELVKPSQPHTARQETDNSRPAQQSAQNRTFNASNRTPFSAFGSRPGNKSQSESTVGKRSASEQTENWSLPELNITKSLGAFADVLMQVATMSGNVQAAGDRGLQLDAFTNDFSFYDYCVGGAPYSYMSISFSGGRRFAQRAINASPYISKSFTDSSALLAAFNACVYQDDAVAPPAFEASSAAAISDTEIRINVDVDKAAKVYYAVSSSPQSPTNTMVTGQAAWRFPSAIVAESTISSGSLDGDFAASVTVAGLTAGTRYYVYLVAEDSGDDTLVSAYTELELVTPSIPAFNSTTTVTNILTPFNTDSGYGGAREAVELQLDLSIESDIHYVALPTTDTAPTAAQVIAKAADSNIPLSGVSANVAANGKYTISGLTADSEYTLYSVATYPGDSSLASAVQATSLGLITGTDTLLFDDWARLADPDTDYVTFYDKTPTISGSADNSSTLFVKLNGTLLASGDTISGIDSPKTPRTPLGNKKCVNDADSCADYLSHWHITLNGAVSDDVQTLEIVSDNGSGIEERAVLKFKISAPPAKFKTTVTPSGDSGEKYEFEFSAYERDSVDDMTLLTWNGQRYVKYTTGITGTLTYRGRVTNWGEGGGGMAWATLYPDGQMITMINYGKAGEEGKTLTFDTNNSAVFSGFENGDSIIAPALEARAEKEISYTWSSHPGAMYKQVWRDDKINTFRDYYDPDIGLTMMLGANNSMDWIMARDLDISLNLKTAVLPAQDFYVPIPEDGQAQFETDTFQEYQDWRTNLGADGSTAVINHGDFKLDSFRYCDTANQNPDTCAGTVPETNLNVIHVVGYGLGGRRDLDSDSFYKMYTNLTRAKAGTGLHELGHTLALGHCSNQRDTMCAGGGFWFGRDGQQRAKQNIASFSSGGSTLATGTSYAAPLPPYSGEDYHRMTAGTSSLIDVLANDEDNNGDTVTIAEVDSTTFFGGTATIEAGKVRYTPPTGFTGIDYFAYQAQSGTSGSNSYFTNTALVSVYVMPADTAAPVVHFNFEETDYDILNNVADLDNTTFAYIKPNAGGTEFTFATAGAKISGAAGSGFKPSGTSGIIVKHYPEPIDKSQTISMWFNLKDVSGFGSGDQATLWDSGPIAMFVNKNEAGDVVLNFKAVPEGSYGKETTFTSVLDVSTADTWHHAALVIDRETSTIKAYLDGQAVANGISQGTAFSNGQSTIPAGAIYKGKSSASIGIGNAPDIEEGEDTPDFAINLDDTVFNSAVDEFKIFNRALSASDISAQFTNIGSDTTSWSTHDGILANQLKGGGFDKVGGRRSAVSGINFNTTITGRIISTLGNHPDFVGDRKYPSIGSDFDGRLVEIRNQNGEIGSLSRFLGFYKSGTDYSLQFDLAKKRSASRPAMDFNVWAGGRYGDHSRAVKIASAVIADNDSSSGAPAWASTSLTLSSTGNDASALSAKTPVWLEITNKSTSSQGAAALIDNLAITTTGLTANSDAAPDTDGDGVANSVDDDDDGDGVLDSDDAFPLIALGALTDTDSDGAPDSCDAACISAGMTADTNTPVIDSTRTVFYDTTPFIKGTGAAGTTIALSSAGNSLGSATVNSDGNWYIESAALSKATHSLIATSDGNTSAAVTVELKDRPDSFSASYTISGTKYDIKAYKYSVRGDNLKVYTWDGSNLVEYTTPTEVPTYRGRITNYPNSKLYLTWYNNGQLKITGLFDRGESYGIESDVYVENLADFTALSLPTVTTAPKAKYHFTSGYSTYFDLIRSQLQETNTQANFYDTYDLSEAVALFEGAVNSGDGWAARDIQASVTLDAVVLPIPPTDSSVAESTWNRFEEVYDPRYDTRTDSAGLSLPTVKMWWRHKDGAGGSGVKDYENDNFVGGSTNITKQNFGAWPHEVGHSLDLGHYHNQQDMMASGGQFYAGRDSWKRMQSRLTLFPSIKVDETYTDPMHPYAPDYYAHSTPTGNVDIDVLYEATDINGDTLSLSAYSARSEMGGVITDQGAGVLRYTPPAGFTGKDTFKYTITDDGTNPLTSTSEILVNVYPADSLIVYLPFEETKHNVIQDFSGSTPGNFGLIQGNKFPAASSAGVVGNAVDLNGTAGIKLGDLPDPLTGSQTISFWFKAQSGHGDAILFDTGSAGSLNKSGISVELTAANQLNVYVQDEDRDDTGEKLTPAVTVTDGTWTHLALVIDRENATPHIRLYIDGTETNNVAFAANRVIKGRTAYGQFIANALGFQLKDQLISAPVSNYPEKFKGSIDEFKIHNYPLTSAEVSSAVTSDSNSSTAVATQQIKGLFEYPLANPDFDRSELGLQEDTQPMKLGWKTINEAVISSNYHPDQTSKRIDAHSGSNMLRMQHKTGKVPRAFQHAGFFVDAMEIDVDFYVAKLKGKNFPACEVKFYAGGDSVINGATLASSGAVEVGSYTVAAGSVADDLLVKVDASVTLSTPAGSSIDESSPLWIEFSIATTNQGDTCFVDTVRLSGTLPTTVPTATANSNAITEDDAVSVTGNVLTDDDGAGVDSHPNSDTLTVSAMDKTGADQYGSLTHNTDGSYTYTIDNTIAAVQALNTSDTLTETYTYTVSDDSGDTDTAALTITINGANEPSADSDGDGVDNATDAFPNDSTESVDTDGDGVGDNADVFPTDSAETSDTDSDGVGDNADAFPNNSAETSDTDGDGVGDNADAFPLDPTASAVVVPVIPEVPVIPVIPEIPVDDADDGEEPIVTPPDDAVDNTDTGETTVASAEEAVDELDAVLDTIADDSGPLDAEGLTQVDDLNRALEVLADELDVQTEEELASGSVSESTVTSNTDVATKSATATSAIAQSIDSGTVVAKDSLLDALSSSAKSSSTASKVLKAVTEVDARSELLTQNRTILTNSATLISALANDDAELTVSETSKVKEITGNLVSTSNSLAESGDAASTAYLKEIAAQTNTVLEAQTALGIAADTELVEAVSSASEAMATRVIEEQLATEGETLTTQQIAEELSTNTQLFEDVLEASLPMPPSVITPQAERSDNILQARPQIAPAVQESVLKATAKVVRADKITLKDGKTALEKLLDYLKDQEPATAESSNPRIRNAVALTREPEIRTDEATGIITIIATDGAYIGMVVGVRSVPDSVPRGFRFRADGSATVITEGTAIELAPNAFSLLDFIDLAETTGFAYEQNADASFSLDVGGGQRFVGTFAYDDLIGVGSNLSTSCGELSVVAPSGAENAAAYSYGINCANGISQRVVPFIDDSNFFDSVRAFGLAVSVDRNSGVVSIGEIGQFKPSFFTEKPTEAELAYHASEADSFGVALQSEDLNFDGVDDYKVISSDSVQVMYGRR